MTIVPKKKSDSRSTNKSNVVPKKEQEHQDEHQNQDHRRSPHQCSSRAENVVVEDVDYSGYNSGDEHTHDRRPSYMQWTEQEYQEKEIQFEKKINKKGWVIRKMAEDGACLFRAVADQIYGDQDMHSVLRKLCIDYIVSIIIYFLSQVEINTIVDNLNILSFYIYHARRPKTLTTSHNMLQKILANI